MRITKLQEGNIVAIQDNTRVVKPDIPELIKAKPRQYYITDLGGNHLLITELPPREIGILLKVLKNDLKPQ